LFKIYFLKSLKLVKRSKIKKLKTEK